MGDRPLGQHQRVGVRHFVNLPTNAYVSFYAAKTLGSPDMGYAFYKSSINKWALPGTGGVNLGTFSVNLVQCTTGY